MKVKKTITRLIKQRRENVFFNDIRLANTSLHQVYLEI